MRLACGDPAPRLPIRMARALTGFNPSFADDRNRGIEAGLKHQKKKENAESKDWALVP